VLDVCHQDYTRKQERMVEFVMSATSGQRPAITLVDAPEYLHWQHDGA
jgi:hypothetical protein